MRIRLDIPISLSEITGQIDDTVVEYLSTDTREMSQGDLFIPIKGKRFNGQSFVDEAKSRGAIVIDSDDGALTLLKIAALYKSKLTSLKYTIGITGSVGKTTAKEFIYKIASQKFRAHKTKENENNIIGVAKTILEAPKDTELLILEIGTNNIGEIKRIVDVIPMDISLITNIGTSHIGNFGSRDAIAREKLSIQGEGSLITRYEDSLSGFKFSSKCAGADLYIEKIDNRLLVYKFGKQICDTTCAFSESHLIEEVAGAVSVCVAMGLESKQVNLGISLLSYENTRQKIIKLKNITILSDCYNASLESFSAAFNTVSGMKEFPVYSAVIGDIDELCEMSNDIHRRLGAMLVGYNFRKIYVLGDMNEYVKHGYSDARGDDGRLKLLDHKKPLSDIADEIIRDSAYGEIILFKASRKMRLELLIDEIKRRCEA